MKFQQLNFSGGMNMLLDPDQLADNEYVYAENVRCRLNTLQPVKNQTEVDLTTLYLISGGTRLQGIRVFGQYLLAFSAGQAFYLDTALVGADWVQIEDLVMSALATSIYTELVPASTINMQRKLSSATDVLSPINLAPTTTSGTLAAVVCQDGATRPWIIYIDAGLPVARVCYDYADWDNTVSGVREYVPIGTFMKFFNGILYLIADDNTKIYRSVSGRPLDFMVNVDNAGAKASLEADGGAASVSYAVGYDKITCFQILDTDALFVATSGSQCWAVTPDYNNKIFGEPTFQKRFLFQAAVANQNSFISMLGDFAFITKTGIRSFNAVQQQLIEGNNNIFSQKIASLFEGVTQTALFDPSTVGSDANRPCAAIFDNYALFSVKTTQGNVIVVYDTLNKTFPCVDTYRNADFFIEFAVMQVGPQRMFGITQNTTGNAKMFEFYTGDYSTYARVDLREMSANDPAMEQKPENLRVVFGNMQTDGLAMAIQRSDGIVSGKGSVQQKTILQGTQQIMTYPVGYPATYTNGKKNLINTFWNIQYGGSGLKMQFHILWLGGGFINDVTTDNTDLLPNKSQIQTQ